MCLSATCPPQRHGGRKPVGHRSAWLGRQRRGGRWRTLQEHEPRTPGRSRQQSTPSERNRASSLERAVEPADSPAAVCLSVCLYMCVSVLPRSCRCCPRHPPALSGPRAPWWRCRGRCARSEHSPATICTHCPVATSALFLSPRINFPSIAPGRLALKRTRVCAAFELIASLLVINIWCPH